MTRTAFNAPRHPQLSLIGYWSGPHAADRWGILPDPRHLVVEWDEQQKRRVLAYLLSGEVYRVYVGASTCRFGCSGSNGSTELWDGTFVWPRGLAHYVGHHSVGLPESFLRHMANNDFRVPTLPYAHFEPLDQRACLSEFLRWVASRVAPPERDDTLSLAEARERAAQLSTTYTRFEVRSVHGWWQLTGGGLDVCVEPQTRAGLDKWLLPLRVAETPLPIDEANALAASLCGPSLKLRYRNYLPIAGRRTVTLESPLESVAWMEDATDALGVEARVELEQSELDPQPTGLPAARALPPRVARSS